MAGEVSEGYAWPAVDLVWKGEWESVILRRRERVFRPNMLYGVAVGIH
jgi:hypothetical protein